MNQLWFRFTSREVRFRVTLSPTSTSIRGPGVVKEVFVDPQPPLRLPYNQYVGRFRPAAAGVANEEAAKRHAKVAATRILRRRVDMASHPMVGRRDVFRHKSIGLNGRVVREPPSRDRGTSGGYAPRSAFRRCSQASTFMSTASVMVRPAASCSRWSAPAMISRFTLVIDATRRRNRGRPVRPDLNPTKHIVGTSHSSRRSRAIRRSGCPV